MKWIDVTIEVPPDYKPVFVCYTNFDASMNYDVAQRLIRKNGEARWRSVSGRGNVYQVLYWANIEPPECKE